MSYVPPLSLLDVLEELVESGDPGDEFSDVVYSLGFSDRFDVEQALLGYANDDRLSAEDRGEVGECLANVWKTRGSCTWEAYDTLRDPARSRSRTALPGEMHTLELMSDLDELLAQDSYLERKVNEKLWEIRNTHSPTRDQALSSLATDQRLSDDHRGLVSEMVATKGTKWNDRTGAAERNPWTSADAAANIQRLQAAQEAPPTGVTPGGSFTDSLIAGLSKITETLFGR